MWQKNKGPKSRRYNVIILTKNFCVLDMLKLIEESCLQKITVFYIGSGDPNYYGTDIIFKIVGAMGE